jgi:hypothetical protein
VVHVTRHGGDELAVLKPLIRDYPFKPYRTYRALSTRAQAAVMEAEIAAALQRDGLLLRHAPGEAALVFRRLSWDSDFFGVPMARIDCILGARDAREPIDDLVEECVAMCRRDGVRHLSIRIDVADVTVAEVLEDHRFRIVDSMLTYVMRPHRSAPPPERPAGVVRPMTEDDVEAILSIARERFTGFAGRFHVDRHLPRERADEFYVEWTRKCCRGEMAEEVLVAERPGGEVIGFLAFRKREPVSSAGGVAVYGDGLGACRRDSPGAYVGLLHQFMISTRSRGAVGEAQTQSSNVGTVRTYESVGGVYARADLTFHAWLG